MLRPSPRIDNLIGVKRDKEKIPKEILEEHKNFPSKLKPLSREICLVDSIEELE